jgi:hypothetical protein
MPNRDKPESKAQRSAKLTPLAGYPAESKTVLDQRAARAKLNRYNTRILPSPIALRGEYNRLASSPKCGRRGALAVLAKKYRVSQAAVIKVLQNKGDLL